jgi:hypothetical protein
MKGGHTVPKTKEKAAPPSIGGRSEVKKHNNAIHVGGDLSLVGRKLVNVLLLNAYDDLARVRVHTIPVPLLCDLIGWESSGNIDSLKEALRQLATTPIEFDLFNRDGKPTWDVTAMVAHARIEGGVCRYEYSEFLAGKLADPEMYSIINIGVYRDFKGAYSLALYENCLRFRGTESGSTGWWPIKTWRKVLGANAALYDEFKFFSNKVIKPAVAEIEAKSDLLVKPEYRREGRNVSEIRFLVADNPQRSMFDFATDSPNVHETEAYKVLTSIGVGRTLAKSMVQKDEVRALEIGKYTVERMERGEITGSAGGYARRLYETNAVVAKPEKPKKKAAVTVTTATDDDAQSLARAEATTAAVLALTPEQRTAHVEAFTATHKVKGPFLAETGHFKNKLEDIAFTSFLRSQVAAGQPA